MSSENKDRVKRYVLYLLDVVLNFGVFGALFVIAFGLDLKKLF